MYLQNYGGNTQGTDIEMLVENIAITKLIGYEIQSLKLIKEIGKKSSNDG